MEKTTDKTNNYFKKEVKNCWIITEGMAGTENQCLAVAERLDISYSVKRIALQQPFKTVSPFVFKTCPRWTIKGIDWTESHPDMIIASGRKAIPVALKFPNAFKVFIQNPKIDPNYFDLVAAPIHDNIIGSNVIQTVAAPNRITHDNLAEAASKFNFSSPDTKKIAILIGGQSKTHDIPDNFVEYLKADLATYLNDPDYAFLVTVSRRTPNAVADKLKSLFACKNCTFWDGRGENPYHAFLASADYILVTEDSASMLSDACSTGKPVYRIAMSGGSAKFERLYKALQDKCGMRIFKGDLDRWTYTPLNDAQLIADEIEKAFAKKSPSF